MDLLYQWVLELFEKLRISLRRWICELFVPQQPPEVQNAHVAPHVRVGAIPSSTPTALSCSSIPKLRNIVDGFVDPIIALAESTVADASFQHNKKQSQTSSSTESVIRKENYENTCKGSENTTKIGTSKRSIADCRHIPVEKNVVKSVNASSLSKKRWEIYVDEPGPSSKMSKSKYYILDAKGLRLSSGRQRKEKRRTRVPDRPNNPLNLWTIIKNFIGHDLSRIPLSVHFFEPISMLQRIAEDFEYAELLDKAAVCQTTHEQLAYLAAFVVASYSSTDTRMLKPFNPLLGETFEFDRTEDLGWRLIAEQVSHHPPVSVIYCESKNWKFINQWEPSTKLTPNSIVMTPKGSLHVEFLNSGHKYTWTKVTTTARNIILGTMYLDHSGETVIKSEGQNVEDLCYLRYIPYSTFAKQDYRKIQAEVVDKNNMVKMLIEGFWNSNVEIAEVSSSVPWEREKSHTIMSELSARTIWTKRLPDSLSEAYYNFSIFASELNEEEEGVAPTDSRLRPDQRLMEQGHWDEANKTKAELEQNQRLKKDLTHNTAWFLKKEKDGEVIYEYGNEYWDCKNKQDWSRCPDIFKIENPS